MWYKVKRILVGTQQVRPERNYEYYCNFRNSSQSAMTSDWWSIKTWTPTFSANGISGSSVRAFKWIPTLTSTSKIKLKCWFILQSWAALAYSLTEAYSTWTYKSNLWGSYFDGINQTEYSIWNTIYYIHAVSGTGTWEMNIDLGNNTVTYSNSLYNSWAIQTKTISAAEKTNVLLATNIRILLVGNATDNATIQDLSILIK